MGVPKKIKAYFTGGLKAKTPSTGETRDAADHGVQGASSPGHTAAPPSERAPIQPGDNYGLTALYVPPSLSDTG